MFQLNTKVIFISLYLHYFFQFPEFDDLYCKYSFVYGQDWVVTSVSRLNNHLFKKK